jgi:hypothetical protein
LASAVIVGSIGNRPLDAALYRLIMMVDLQRPAHERTTHHLDTRWMTFPALFAQQFLRGATSSIRRHRTLENYAVKISRPS